MSKETKFSLVMVIERFFPLVGGAETQCYQLSEQFAKRGAKVLVFTKRWYKNLLKEEKLKNKFAVWRLGIPGNGRLADYLSGFYLALFLFKRRARYQLIYVNGGLANVFGSTAILMSRLLAKTVVAKVETPGELFFSGPRALSPKRWVHPLIKLRLFLARKADFYIAQTSGIRKELLALGILEKQIKNFHNSVDVKLFKPIASVEEKKKLRADLGLPGNKVLVLFCGRLVQRKGLVSLLEAWETVAKTEKEAVLLLLGSGENQPDSVEDQLKAIVGQKRLKNIYFLGEKQKPIVARCLRAVDIFVYPSIHAEGTALCILEAMSCGLPVVATKVGGLEDVIEDRKDGVLVEKKNPQALSLALKALIRDSRKRAKIGRKAREKVLSRYSNVKVSGQYFRFLSELGRNKQ